MSFDREFQRAMELDAQRLRDMGAPEGSDKFVFLSDDDDEATEQLSEYLGQPRPTSEEERHG